MEMRARLAEEHFFYFFYHFSQETQQQAQMWENAKRESYQAQCGNFEHQIYQETAQERLNVEAAAGQHVHALRQELQEAEEEHTHHLRQEARRFAEGNRAEYAAELHHHQIAQTQAQSLLAAERQDHTTALEEQSTRSSLPVGKKPLTW